MIDYKKFVENSRKWLSNYIKDNYLQSLVIGISGGIDSTVSCAISSPVCKELNIPLIGRSLPCNTNKEEETNTANLVGRAFCTDYKEVTIEPMYRVIENELSLNEGSSTRLQSGNIKARLRMIYLRHLASVHKGVVLDNDNFTEWNLGFWTVGGDSPMDINLGLHYLWKTEVYELAKFLLEKQNHSESETQESKIADKEASRERRQDIYKIGKGFLRDIINPIKSVKERYYIDNDKINEILTKVKSIEDILCQNKDDQER